MIRIAQWARSPNERATSLIVGEAEARSMNEPVRIFVTTCREMWRVEKALEYSILKYTRGPVSVTFLRSGDPGWLTNVDAGLSHETVAASRPDLWNVGRSHPLPYSGQGWQTPFSCFRFTIPELCGFEGRAIHMDADFLVTGDLRDVFEAPMSRPVVGPAGRTDFMLIDCAAFRNLDWWPSIAQMRPSGWNIERHYKRWLKEHDFIAPSDPSWESWDGNDFVPGVTKTIHYTNMHTQPWKPFPHFFKYPPHPNPPAACLFWEHYAEALEKEQLGIFIPQARTPGAELYADVGQPAYLTTLAVSRYREQQTNRQ
jgi:hypothetical protein